MRTLALLAIMASSTFAQNATERPQDGQAVIFVVGTVSMPGAYRLTPQVTALSSITLAGGMQRPPSDSFVVRLIDGIAQRFLASEQITILRGGASGQRISMNLEEI